MQWGVCVLGVLLAGCLGGKSSACGDGLVCREGSVCVAALDLCAAPTQLAACAGMADGAHCATDDILIGSCNTGVCVVFTGCGNGVMDPGEVCDDGNTISGDGCSADCKSTEVCGNGIVDDGEACDCGVVGAANPSCPGPNSDLAGPCSTACKLRCGDGIVEPDEACDPAISAKVGCAGALFDRGLTTCSASCQPVLDPAVCKYIGWRTRTEDDVAVPRNLASTGAGTGFFVAGTVAGQYTDYVPITMGSTFFNSAPLVSMRAVWAAVDGTAVAVGDSGLIVRWDGAAWASPSKPPTSIDLRDVWGRSATDVYAIGDGIVLHGNPANPSSWAPVPPPVGGFRPGAVRAISGDVGHIYVAGDDGSLLVGDDTAWSAPLVGTGENLAGVSATEVLVVAVGANGTIVQSDDHGTSWVRGRVATTANLTSVWGGPLDGFFAVGEGGTVLFDDANGNVWRPLALGRGFTGAPDQPFSRVTGLDGIELGILGTTDVPTYEGAAWSPVAVPPPLGSKMLAPIFGLWGDTTDDVFAVGHHGTILHHDGLSWTQQPAPTTADLRAVWGTGPHDVYAVGDDGTLLHYDGASWLAIATTITDRFTSLFVADQDHVFIGGSSGVYQSTGLATPDPRPSIIGNDPAVWGTDSTSVFAGTSTYAAIDFFNGSSWRGTLAAVPNEIVTAISGTSPADVYTVGSDPSHYDGVAWSPGPFEAGLTSITATEHGVFAVGGSGSLRSWNGSAVEPFLNLTSPDLNAVFMIDNVVFIADADGALDILVFRK